MSRTARRIITGVLVVILVLMVVLAVLIPYSFSRSFPRIKGQIQVEGLQAPVEIYRDSFGVPHIYATNSGDIFFAQGYVHAQDRFWQMDFWRHIGSGRLAEMFGEGQLENDQILRTLGFARVVEQELDNIDATSLAVLESYTRGVNAYLAEHQGLDLSLEYGVLKLINPDYQPEPWQPLHSVTWGKVMAWDLGGNMDAEIEKATLLGTLSPQQVAEIVPPYSPDRPVIVSGFQISANSGSSSFASAGYPAQFTAVLQNLKDKFDLLDGIIGPGGIGIGSNSWAVSGQRTKSEMPYLANDPHLGAQMPAIWYEVGLHCVEEGAGCPYNVTGFSFAGVPGVIIGHNDRVAWGFTNGGPDVQDLYIEKINPLNPNQYEVNGEWVDMVQVQETIHVAGGEPQDLTVRYTRHGPVISDTTYLGEDFTEVVGLDLPDNFAIALRWTALEPNHLFRAIWQFNRADNWDEFREGTLDFIAPAQNILYADVDGNIAYQFPGNIPIRAKGDGSLPVPGWTDEYEWTGYIPFDELPYSFNPPSGYIVTANNSIADANYPHLIATVFAHGHRAQRIVDLIENASGPIDMAYMEKMQGDDMSLNAETLVPILMQVPLGTDVEDVRWLLEDWDYQAHMDSPAAALFEAFWVNLLAGTFHDDLPEDTWPRGGSRWFEVVADLVEQPDSPWWDNSTTSPVETRDVIFSGAFSAAVNQLKEALGDDASKWTWGDLHTLTLTNQTLGNSGIAPIDALFNRGPYRTSGGAAIINATGWSTLKPYQTRSLPSMRMIVDLDDLSESQTIHTTGQSGHAFHQNYVDMTDLWRTIQYHPMLWEPERVKDSAKNLLQLVP